MCTCVILSLLRLVINIPNTIVDILKNKQSGLRMYPEKRQVSKAPATPFVLVDIVRCLK